MTVLRKTRRCLGAADSGIGATGTVAAVASHIGDDAADRPSA